MKQLDIRALAEARKNELLRRQREAMARWQPYIDIVEQHYKSQGRELFEYKKANIAQACDNLFDFFVLNRMNGQISEATTSDAIAFARQMLPTIPALLSSLVADEVAVVQTIDRPQAQVYFMNIKAATTKGAVTAADQLIGAKIGHASSEASRLYASDSVVNENKATGDNAHATYALTMTRKPIITGTLVVTAVTSLGVLIETLTFNEAGTATSDLSGGGTGTITSLTAGTASVTFKANVPTGGIVYASYRFNVELDPDGIGGLDIEVVSENVDAMVFPIKLNYSVFSAINLQKIHGMVLADEGMKFATQEIKFAIDQIVLKYALAAANNTTYAATTVGDFNTTVGSTQEYVFRQHEFNRYISKASANIFAKTLRATGNVIIAGINVCALIENLPGYKPAAGIGTKPPAGPYVHGTLNSRLVICNPFYNANDYVVMFRGDNYLFAGLIYAPYVPLYATDPVTLADLSTQRGFMSQAAVKVINYGMFCKGSISNF